MNASFDFIFGGPPNEGPGRWVEGTVAGNGCGYKFTARLMLRRGMILSCQCVAIDIDRPFAPTDFAAYLRSVSTGPFATVTRVCGLYNPLALILKWPLRSLRLPQYGSTRGTTRPCLC